MSRKANRRQILLGAGAIVMVNSTGASCRETNEFPPIAPRDAGFAADLEARLDKAIADKRIWGQHGLLVLRGGQTVLERYFEGEDEARDRGAIGHIAFKPDTIHDLRSCSKSIVALLYGIALNQGKVPPPEAPLFTAFPEYADLASKEGRDRLTIQHVLTMTMGTVPYTDPRNSEIAMDNAPDRYRYILERRVVDTPGVHWSYCGGATALLARLIAKGSGKKLHAFAREYLFDPLGLGPTEWATGPRRRAIRGIRCANVPTRFGAHRGDDVACWQGWRPRSRSRRMGKSLRYARREHGRSAPIRLSMVSYGHQLRQA
jgi:CubicO group peptidase (beta-lactamase class C family)